MKRLDYEMNRKGMNNKGLAGHIDKNPQTVGLYRSGESSPSYEDAQKIAEFVGIDFTTMFDEVDTEGNLIEQPITA
jgi:transcriptional regulator with XRE-family HTH domain